MFEDFQISSAQFEMLLTVLAWAAALPALLLMGYLCWRRFGPYRRRRRHRSRLARYLRE
jgi:predicted MFS family arabinose efflux permease